MDGGEINAAKQNLAVGLATLGIGTVQRYSGIALQGLRNSSKYGDEVKLVDGFYQSDSSAFKFSEYYYNKLWSTGRGGAFIQANEIFQTASSIKPDRMNGFYKLTNEFMEMVYNPTTKEVWHMQPLKKK